MKNKKHIYYLLLILVILFPFKSSAQNNSSCLKNLLELNLKEAKTNITQIESDPEKLYFQLYYYFIQQMVYHQAYDQYEIETDSIYNIIDTKNNMPSYLLSEIYLQKGIIEYVHDNYYTAIKNFNTAYRYWQTCETKYPGNINNLKLKGIFNLLLAHLPSPYKEWAEWFGFKGNKDEGFLALYQYYNIAKTTGQHFEAKLYLAFAMLKFMDQDKKTEAFLMKEVKQVNPDFIKSILIRCAFKIKKPEIFNNWFLQVDDNSFAILHYLKGKYLVQQFSPESITELNKFIRITTDNTFKADAYRYLSWIYLIQNNIQQYNQNQNKLENLNDYPTWEDKQAYYERKSSYYPNKTILKSRLLFDRGEYDKCISLLLKTKGQFSDKNKSSVEYFYRLGRAYQMKTNYESAKINFKIAIDLHELSNRYFAPESAINIAKIEILSGYFNKAKGALDTAKKINKGESKNSISQEIKQLQKEIDDKQIALQN